MKVVYQFFSRTYSWSAETVRKALSGIKISLLVRRIKPKRSEQEVFEDLCDLCCQPGFVHAMAEICFRYNMIWHQDEVAAEDMAPMYSYSRLVRTETTALIGLMMRAPIRLACPPRGVISTYARRATELLNELHRTMEHEGTRDLVRDFRSAGKIDKSKIGGLIREAIFYGGESAYLFQYRDFAVERYRNDAQWLLSNKGIDLELAGKLCRHITELLDEGLNQVRKQIASGQTTLHSLLPGFIISLAELADRANAPPASVRAVVDAFTLPAGVRNRDFNSVDDFNQAFAYPFIRVDEDQFISLQHYGLPQALYDVPFYWMNDDKAYASTAGDHRGDFTEAFAAQRLARVFGERNVYRNVELRRSKGKTISEIDVLVLYGDRAIVVQAKSKRLTIEARKGNQLKLREDFQKAIQDAVDQAFVCSDALVDPTVNLLCGGTTLIRRRRPQKSYPVALIAEHYPALTTQVRHFLQAKSNARIAAPLVIDVFALDAITELLCSPLQLIHYLKLRARFGESFLAHHEHTFLSYHLRHNLVPENEDTLEWLHDDFSAHLEIAMRVRREGMEGVGTPEGILTRGSRTPYGRLIAQLDNKQNPNYIALGLFLLEFTERTMQDLNRRLAKIIAGTSEDGRFRQFDMLGRGSAGLTVHCSRLDSRDAEKHLVEQCRKQKDSRQTIRWFGLAIRPDGSTLWVRKWIDVPNFGAKTGVVGGQPEKEVKVFQ